MHVNKVLQKLREGKPVLVGIVWTVPHWKIVEMMGLAGYDCVWIEMEHSDFTLEQVSQMILAARAKGIETLVRIPRGSYNDVIRPLEAGQRGCFCLTAQAEKMHVSLYGWHGLPPWAGAASVAVWISPTGQRSRTNTTGGRTAKYCWA